MRSTWSAVDRYATDLLSSPDGALAAALEASKVAGLPAIQVSPAQGKLLHLLARMHGARRILEIGTLGGYSAIWLARALPADGRMITLELDPARAELARANLARAGLDDRVEVVVGPALETLPWVAEERPGPFDLVFIDADKASGVAYLDWALRLSRPGSVIIVDNVVRHGALIDAESADPSVQGSRRVLERIAAESRLDATVVQTVGEKGYDGMAIAIVSGGA